MLDRETILTIDKLNEPVGKFLNPVIVHIIIEKMRVSSTFKIVEAEMPRMFYLIYVNENLFTLNTIKDIKAVLRHTIIHAWQLNKGQRAAHTKEFYRLSDILKAEDPKILKRASSNYKTFYFICPDGCQQFSSTDEPEVLCFYCGKEMKKYNSEQYRKYKKTLNRGK